MTNYELTGNKIVETSTKHVGLKNLFQEEEEPERFAPFCSLDTIEEHLKMLTTPDKEMLIDDYRHSIDCIYEEVYALRAYITGMEKSNESEMES